MISEENLQKRRSGVRGSTGRTLPAIARWESENASQQTDRVRGLMGVYQRSEGCFEGILIQNAQGVGLFSELGRWEHKAIRLVSIPVFPWDLFREWRSQRESI